MLRHETQQTRHNDQRPVTGTGGRRRRKLGVVGLAVAGSLALTACGGAAGASNHHHRHINKSNATGALAQVYKTHQLPVAISAFAPQDYQNNKGKWIGYDPAILRKFAKSIGATLKIDSVPFASAIEAVKTHRDDLTIDIYKNPTRA